MREGDEIQLSDKAKNFVSVREALEITADPPAYLYRNKDEGSGTPDAAPRARRDPAPGRRSRSA